MTRGLHPGHPDFSIPQASHPDFTKDTPTSSRTPRLHPGHPDFIQDTLTSTRAPQLQHLPGPPEGHGPLGNVGTKSFLRCPSLPAPLTHLHTVPKAPPAWSLTPSPLPTSLHSAPPCKRGVHTLSPGAWKVGPPPRKDPEPLPGSQGSQGRPGGHPEVGGSQQSHQQGEGDRRCCLHQPSAGGRGRSPRAEGGLWREGLPRAEGRAEQTRGKFIRFVQSLGITCDHVAFLPKPCPGRPRWAG